MTVAPLNAATPSSSLPVYTASARAGRVLLGRTLPSLLDEACTNNPNAGAFNEPTAEGWRSVSSEDFRRQAEAFALALCERGLKPGERVAFFTHSDLSFCLPDMACLMAGLVTVPIYLTQDEASVRLILQETEAHVLVAGDDPDEARLTASYATFCEAAARHGLSADLEFMPWTAVPTLAAAQRIVAAADQPNAAVLVDALHFARSPSRLQDLAGWPRQRLHYAQICDGLVPGPTTVAGLIHDARCERLLPGEGGIDLVELFSRLPADLPISIEVPMK